MGSYMKEGGVGDAVTEVLWQKHMQSQVRVEPVARTEPGARAEPGACTVPGV